MTRSAIEWTDRTWNPTTGCDQVSPGCDNCYALTLAARLQRMGSARYQRDGNPRTSGPGFKLQTWPDKLHQPFSWRTPSMVFVDSMSDLLHRDVPDDFVLQVLDTIARTPQHTYQLLTKRSHRLARLPVVAWPENLWLGVSVETDRYLHRVDHLRATSAETKFVSAEPLLGPLDRLDLAGIDWLIVGGESGPGHRPPQAAWIRDLRDLAADTRTPFFFKQWGGATAKAGGRELDGRIHDDYPTPRTGQTTLL